MWLLVHSAATAGQIETVQLTVSPDRVGLGGVVRPGTWTPLLAQLENRGAEPRQVICEWIVPDADGDPVHVRRSATLDAGRQYRLWLYAALPMSTDLRSRWRVKVIDEASGRLLVQRELEPRFEQILPVHRGVIGVMGSAAMGLTAYESAHTQQEPLTLLRGLSVTDLPDRWYGLSILDALIWTPQGGDPSDPAVPAAAYGALRQWVRRGGHLVIVLPAAGDPWTGSPLADLLPDVAIESAAGVLPPVWLGGPRYYLPQVMTVKRLTPRSPTTVLLTDTTGQPLVVAGAYGLGRVTLIGVDVSDQRLMGGRLPNGPALWSAVFGWRSPAMTSERIDELVADGTMLSPDRREFHEQSGFIGSQITMMGHVAGILLASVVLFGAYWLTAGPVGHAILKRRGLAHHSWVIFVLVVAVFSVVAWVGAQIIRPRQTRIAHFSVLDVEAADGRAHVHSWLSLLVPRHRVSRVTLDPQQVGPVDTLASVGHSVSGSGGEFVDARSYAMAAASPGRDPDDPKQQQGLAVPMRATVKNFEVDYLGRALGASRARYMEDWVLPQGRVTIQGGWPSGELMHGLPGKLRNVIVVYCPGDGRMPWVTRQGDWPPRTALALERFSIPSLRHRLIEDPRPHRQDEKMNPWRGYLGELIRDPGNPPQRVLPGEPQIELSEDQTVRMIERLTFFSALPPPLWDRTDVFGPDRPWHARRTLGRSLDLTPWLAMRCLIVVGHLPDSELPLPLTVDGQTPTSSGWTVVRWICPLPPEGPPKGPPE